MSKNSKPLQEHFNEFLSSQAFHSFAYWSLSQNMALNKKYSLALFLSMCYPAAVPVNGKAGMTSNFNNGG